MSTDDTANMDKHTDGQLEEGLEKVAEQRPRLESEGSQEALEAQEEQAKAMAEELAGRERGETGEAPRSDGASA